VSDTKRRGEMFVDAFGRKWHADEHAALTIACWLLLRLKEVVDTGNGVGAKVEKPSPVPL
jgi:hypothetical protein